MSLNRPSWLMPALTIVITMAVFGGVTLYLNPDRASALDSAAPATGSLTVAADKTTTCANICRSGSNVCVPASACAGGACTVEECLKACEEVGITCSQECVTACTSNGECAGDCSGAGQCGGICTGKRNGAWKTAGISSSSGGCCSR